MEAPPLRGQNAVSIRIVLPKCSCSLNYTPSDSVQPSYIYIDIHFADLLLLSTPKRRKIKTHYVSSGAPHASPICPHDPDLIALNVFVLDVL